MHFMLFSVLMWVKNGLVLPGIILFLFAGLYGLRWRWRQSVRRANRNALEREILLSRLELQQELLLEVSDELHEDIGQLLILTQLTTYSIEEKVGGPVTAPDFKTVFDSLQTGINSVRSLSNKLKNENQPVREVPTGLSQALERIGKAHQMRVDLTIEGSVKPIPQRGEPIVLRIAQEIVGTVLKVSGGKTLKVTMIYTLSSLCISLADDGHGFTFPADSIETQSPLAVGIQNIHRKIAMLGGDCRIVSQHGKGAEVVLTIPLEIA